MSVSEKAVSLDKDSGKPDWRFTTFLGFTAMATGASVMIVEVLGSKVVGPFFGVSLFVWTSLITVTLLALAAGYAVGGYLADRKSGADYLYFIILGAGFFILLIPVFQNVVLNACLSLGLRLGAFTSAATLFGPSLFLLGCVTPYIIKVAATEMRLIGKTVGLFYAVSTAGSVTGAALTGFVLIAIFGIKDIFFFTGSSLILLSVVYFTGVRKKWLALIACVLPALSLAITLPAEAAWRGKGIYKEIYSKDTFYGNVQVVDLLRRKESYRLMTIDGLIQGGLDKATGISPYIYTYYMRFIPYAIKTDGEKALVTGLGMGAIPEGLEKMGFDVDVVEINPHIYEVARTYFNFDIKGDLFIADARQHMIRTKTKYDYIITDLFTGDMTPGHLFSIEAIRATKKRLNENGIFVTNIIVNLKDDRFMTNSVIKTIGQAFETVEIYPTFDPASSSGSGNFIIVAYDGEPRPKDIGPIINLEKPANLKGYIEKNLFRQFRFPKNEPFLILTDDYNPSDHFYRRLKENFRLHRLKSLDLKMLGT